ncbi:unnamed protein product [Prorocentrum cordatum]|uniref:Solute carrier family 40 protein n=1 Tax=Prorocentrum cordatum TaxID=2364126 RepID=A0ABN9VNE7_9DINO|nr:unnamed protein product [Polarella glacialis]
MDWMAFSLDAMNFFAVLPGFVLDRFGATVVFAGSACNNLVGFTLLTLGSRGILPVEAAIVSMPFLGQASIWAVMATLSVLGQLIVPEDKGKAIGCCMTWFSLAPVVVKTLVYAATGTLSHPEVNVWFYPICGLILLSGGLLGVFTLLAVPLSRAAGTATLDTSDSDIKAEVDARFDIARPALEACFHACFGAQYYIGFNIFT